MTGNDGDVLKIRIDAAPSLQAAGASAKGADASMLCWCRHPILGSPIGHGGNDRKHLSDARM